MLLEHIAPLLDKSPFFKELNRLEPGTQIHNLNQSARALLAAYYWQESQKSVILVSQDDIIAEELWEDLIALVGRNNAFYLPDYETLPYEERSPHYSIRATRLNSLIKSLDEKPAIYSLSIRSFMRLMPSKELLSKNVFTLKKGDSFEPDKLITKLFNMGYDVEYQATTVYQCAKRGGIVDLFSPANEDPVRLEFWGDEISSIRAYSAATQRSISGEINEILVVPAREIALDDIDSGSVIIAKVRDHGFFEGIENYFSLLTDQLCSFADYFPASERILLFSNYNYIKEEMLSVYEQTVNQYQKELKTEIKGKIPEPDRIVLDEAAFSRIRRQSRSYFLSQSEFIFPERKNSLRAPFTPQPPFEADIPLLSESIIASENDHILLFDNNSQAKRMREIIDKAAEYSPHIGVIHQGFTITDVGLSIWTDHEIFNRYKRRKYSSRFAPGETIIDYDDLKPGDYVVHVDHGVGVFEGLKIIKLDGQDVECLIIRYANEDRVYVPTFQLSLVTKYVAEEGVAPTLNRIGSVKWQNTKKRVAQQIELIAADLVRLYAERSARPGISHKPDTGWQRDMEESFIYEDTPDQARASAEIKQNMERPSPMERLLCGDVGFGKTEVAIRAAFKAVNSGYQAAILAPTTLLAEQHYRVFKERLAQYPVHIAMLSRFRSKEMLKKDIADIKSGRVDIAIGTHRLLSKDISFPRLGLLVVDEEHRFGVRHKDRLRKLQSNVDTLYMSATPIPRTLNMALTKLKEISLMQTSPKERLPIRTIITPRDMQVIKDAIQRETDRGGQVFFVHNRVQTIDTIANELMREMPDISFAVGHAQMPEKALETVMKAFVNKEFQVLISTTIIENGIDIPNANTILIDRADNFGLAQLYQMRGRVGRSNRRAYAYLLIPKGTTAVARKRLEALTQYDYLGAGFQVALRDLELRGAGTILGTKQSGIIQAIGFNYYNRMLKRAIEAAESGEAFDIEHEDDPTMRRNIRSEIDLYFPEGYIDDDEERLRSYRRLAELSDLPEIADFEMELEDRFGALPENARWLMMYFKVDILAKQHELKTCTVKNNNLILEYYPDKMPPKEKILKLSSKISEPLSFDASRGLRVIVQLDKDLEPIYQFERTIEILSAI
ncbi:MAG TPA: transcription-repair coupling factor [Candidatus Cloacimonetes bacterium]|nr:transcription-repair coupling factor [Candidatus Cloacimonadota bacterium]